MPQYELSLVLRTLERPELIEAIKRTSQYIVEKGGIIRSFENVGHRQFPYKLTKERTRYKEGNYFLISFDSPSSLLMGLKELTRRDLDIIRPRILRREMEMGRPCHSDPCHFGELTEEARKKLHMDLNKFVKKL